MTKDYGYSVSVIKVFSMADEYQELTLKYCSCLVETLSISNRTRLWLMSPDFGSLGSMVATWIKEFTNWFEIAHFRYKIIKSTKLSLKQVYALKECNSQQCRSLKKKAKIAYFTCVFKSFAYWTRKKVSKCPSKDQGMTHPPPPCDSKDK